MTVDQIEKKWPFKNLPRKEGDEEWQGIFAPDNGVINVQLLLRTLSRLANHYGAHSRQQIQVTKLIPAKKDGKSIWTVKGNQTGKGEVDFMGRKIAITAGAYVNQILEPSFNLSLDLDIWEMTASYWNVSAGPNGTVFPSMKLPKSVLRSC